MTTDKSPDPSTVSAVVDDGSKTDSDFEIIVTGGGFGFPPGLVDHLSKRGRVIVIDDRHMLSDCSKAMLQAMAPAGMIEDRYAIRASKGKKSRWNRDNRWR